jgi:hypothetical protein
MPDIGQIKLNVSKMVQMGAPEADIDAYIAAEGASLESIRGANIKGNEGTPSGMGKAFVSGAAQEVGLGKEATQRREQAVGNTKLPLTDYTLPDISSPVMNTLNRLIGNTAEYQPVGKGEQAFENMGRMVTGAVPGMALGQGPARALIRGGVVPALASEGAAGLTEQAGYPEYADYARMAGAVFGPLVRSGPTGKMGLSPEQMTLRRNLMEMGARPTPGQSLGDPKRMMEESAYYPTRMDEQKKAITGAATEMAGRRSPNGVTSTNPLTGNGKGWLDERAQTLGPLTPIDPVADAQYARMKALQRASDNGQKPYPTFDDIIKGAEANTHPNAVARGDIDLSNLGRAAKEGMPELPPEPKGWWNRNVFSHYSPLASVAALGAGGFFGHHVGPELLPFLPAIAAGAVGGAAGAGGQLAARRLSRGLRIGERAGGAVAISPYNAYSPPDAFTRALIGLQNNQDTE